MPITPKIAAEKIREAADKWENSDPQAIPQIQKVYADDAADLRKLAGMVEDENFNKSIRYASSLDTLVRGRIPTDIWEWLMNE